MDFNAAEIEVLTLSEIAGTLSEEERVYLYECIAANEEAYLLWQQLHEELPPEILEQIQPLILTPEQLIRKSKKRQRSRHVAHAITMLIIVVMLGGRLLQIYYPVQQSSPFLATSSPGEIQLQLANGKNIILSGNTHEVQVGSILFTIKDNLLSYTPVDSTALQYRPTFKLNQMVAEHMRPEGANPANYVSLYVPLNRDYNLLLIDGTKVHLNGNTRVNFPTRFNGPKRDIAISGEAYLDVTPHAQQPFIVHLPDGSNIDVIGTEFNVNTYNKEVKVSLVTGAANLKCGNATYRLSPGYETVREPGQPVRIISFNKEEISGWHTGTYIFREKSLGEISNIIRHWYKIRIVFDNDQVGNMRMTGIIRRDDPLCILLEDLKYSARYSGHYFDQDSVLHFK